MLGEKKLNGKIKLADVRLLKITLIGKVWVAIGYP